MNRQCQRRPADQSATTIDERNGDAYAVVKIREGVEVAQRRCRAGQRVADEAGLILQVNNDHIMIYSKNTHAADDCCGHTDFVAPGVGVLAIQRRLARVELATE